MAATYALHVQRGGKARFEPIDRPLRLWARGKVLEVGCGDGRLLHRVGGLGVDISAAMARKARARGLPVAVGAAEQLPISSHAVDTVLSGFYAMRFVDLDLALPEIARVLKPGGRFAFTLLGRRVVELAGWVGPLPLLLRRRTLWAGARALLGGESSPAWPNDVTSAAELTRRLKQAGLRVELVLGTPYVPVLSGLLARATGGYVPYWRGRWAAWLGYDVIILGSRL